MRLFSKFLPKPKDPELARNWAVFTALFLIFCSYIIAGSFAFGLPLLLVKVLPNDASEAVKLFVSVILGFAISGFFAWISWDTIDAMVGSAIKADVTVAKEQLNKEMALLRQENSEKEYIKLQDLEFCAVVLKSSDNGGVDGIDQYSDESLQQAFRKRVTRDAIISGLAYNDDLLKKIALASTKKALDKADISGKEASQDETVTLFRHDIYIYLKAWLMHSISNNREMDTSIIKQRCLNKQTQYVEALLDIKENLIKKNLVRSSLKADYYSDAIKMLEEYLNKLIFSLQESNDTTNIRKRPH